MGSCVFNLAALVVVDFLCRAEPIYRRASRGHILSAGFGVVMIGFAGLNVLLGSKAAAVSAWHIGAYMPMILLLYLVAMRAVFRYERDQIAAHAQDQASRYLFRRGPLLAHVSQMHAISAVSAVVMSGIVVVAVLYRPKARIFRTVGWVSPGLFTFYLLNAYVLYLHGE